MTNLKVTQRQVSALNPYHKNARQHSKAQLRKLKASIKEFGWVNPILVDDTGMVLCGHGRLAAAKELGIAEGLCQSKCTLR